MNAWCANRARKRPPGNQLVSAFTVREWQELPIGESGVSLAAAQRLHALAERETRRLRVAQPVLSRTARPGLRAGQVVGVLSVPGANLEILPKIDGETDGGVRRSLTRMLAVAFGLPVAERETSSMATQRENLLELLVRLFADRLLVAVRRGLPLRYQRREEELSLLRGKLDIRRQLLRHATRADRLACTYDELSVDTPLNRVLSAAVRWLSGVTRIAANGRKLGELSARFESVGESADPLAELVRLDRTNITFHRLHALARLFLAGDWQSTMAGGKEGFTLLFAMNDLFEVYMGRSIQIALASRSVRLQRRDRYALEEGQLGRFRLKPDIVVDSDIVIDTKWKRLDPGKTNLGVVESDIYQMLAYARAYRARHLVLLYPWHEALPEAGICRRWRVSGSCTTFNIATVDISRPNAMQTTLREIASAAA